MTGGWISIQDDRGGEVLDDVLGVDLVLDRQAQERTKPIWVLRVACSNRTPGADKIKRLIGLSRDVSNRAGKEPGQMDCSEGEPVRLALGASRVQLIAQHIAAQSAVDGGVGREGESHQPHRGEVPVKFERPESRAK